MSSYFWDLADLASYQFYKFYDNVRIFRSTTFRKRTRQLAYIKRRNRNFDALDLDTSVHYEEQPELSSIEETEKFQSFIRDRRKKETFEHIKQSIPNFKPLLSASPERSNAVEDMKIKKLEDELQNLRSQMLLFMNEEIKTTTTSEPSTPAPPPPAPPMLGLDLNIKSSPYISRIKGKKTGSPSSSSPSSALRVTTKPHFSSQDIISQGRKLRKSTVSRSPGGTPMKQNQPNPENIDPQAIIARALQNKFKNIRSVSPKKASSLNVSVMNDSAWD